MHQIRSIKEQEEIDLMQTACDITEKGFRRILGMIKPGVMEYEIEAELIHEFTKNGSKGFAYQPIIASGSSSCVLHYLENDKTIKGMMHNHRILPVFNFNLFNFFSFFNFLTF